VAYSHFRSKGLRDGILCFLLLAVIFAFKKNVMYSLPIFPQIVDDYKRHLRSGVTPPQCFYQFVKPYHVRYVSLTQWMRRHGLSVQQLQYDALLEKCGTHRDEVLAQLSSKMQPDIHPVILKGKGGISEDKLLRKVSVTFPDGLVVSIVEASSAALYDFINRYNHLLDSQDVRIG
jgi:hypothetical protein